MRALTSPAPRMPPGRGSRADRRPAGFFARVYALVGKIPRGRVASYGQIARMLGAPRSARIVGWAMHCAPDGLRTPCHRVIQQGGTCSPNFRVGDPGAQRHLLEAEGVRFLLDGRVDLEAHQWRPEPDGMRPRRRP